MSMPTPTPDPDAPTTTPGTSDETSGPAAGAGPMQVRALGADGEGYVGLRTVTVPPPGPGEIRVRLRACGVCPGESAAWAARRLRSAVLGHEPAGEVESLGKGVAHLRTGQRVFVHHHAPCGECPACRRGRPVHCPLFRRNSLRPGAMADAWLVSAAAVAADTLPLPDAITDSAATLIEPLACVLRAWSRAVGEVPAPSETMPLMAAMNAVRSADAEAGRESPASVLVLGLGVMGMMHVAAAAARRAEVIIAADRVPHRLRQARGFGATAAVNVDTEPVADRVAGLTDGAGADLVIVGPGSPEAMQLGLSCTAAGGTLLLFSGTPAEAVWPLRPAEVFFREVRVVPSFSAGPADTRAALSALTPPHGWLSAAGHVERLLTHAFPLSRWEAAFDLSARSAEALQVVLRP